MILGKIFLFFCSWVRYKCAISRIPISIPSTNVFFKLLNRAFLVKACERAVDHRECISVPAKTRREISVSIPLSKWKWLLHEAQYGPVSSPY